MHFALIELLGLSVRSLKATEEKVQGMHKCANEMEITAAPNATCADVPCGGEPSVREHCFTPAL